MLGSQQMRRACRIAATGNSSDSFAPRRPRALTTFCYEIQMQQSIKHSVSHFTRWVSRNDPHFLPHPHHTHPLCTEYALKYSTYSRFLSQYVALNFSVLEFAYARQDLNLLDIHLGSLLPRSLEDWKELGTYVRGTYDVEGASKI